MGKFVTPKVFLVGYTVANMEGMKAYLRYTDQNYFLEVWEAAKEEGLSDAECLCSFYAKLCYKSLVEGKNSNISKVRNIPDNVRGTFNQGHGSVFEHPMFNFVITDVSRVFTHELVRHRIGTAFSQTSGRYCRLDEINLIKDPILDDCSDLLLQSMTYAEKMAYLMECRKGLRIPPPGFLEVPSNAYYDWGAPDINEYMVQKCYTGDESEFREKIKWIPNESLKDFDYKKAVTSAIRRIAPNGQSNEIGFSVNWRAARHFTMMRSAPGAEYEIRAVTEQIYNLLNEKFPLFYYGSKTRMVKGALQVYGMKMQPYELDSNDPKALEFFDSSLLSAELERRDNAT